MGVNASIGSLDTQDENERQAAIRLFLRRGYRPEFGFFPEEGLVSSHSGSSPE
ncbi:hypothetical protein [Methanocalculus sp. MC3]